MHDVSSLKRRVMIEVDARRDALTRLADTIHANPELAFQEFESAALLSRTLEENGFAVERGVAGLETAFVATWCGGKEGPTVAFLAEYDALPVLGHACGHNLIGTAAVGAGLALAVVMPKLAGTVQVIGTPAEEAGGGKVIMVDAGVFEGVDVAMMAHPSYRNMTRRQSLTSHRVGVKFYGKPAHAASWPDDGINALDALIQTFNGVNAIRQHLRDQARIHGIILHGGDAVNVVPEYAEGMFGIRAADLAYAHQVIAKVRACAQAGALATGSRLEFQEPTYYYDAMMPNPKLADLVDANMAQLDLEVEWPSPKERMGSSDMGNVSQVVPALHPYFAIGPEDLVGHTIEFREAAGSPAGHQGMLKAAKFMAMSAVDVLAAPDNMRQVLQAFEEQKRQQAG